MFTRYFAFILFSLTLLLSAMKTDTAYFQIEQGSKLQIKGTSNVTDFTCHCLESFPKSQAQITVAEDGTKAKFSKTVLQIRTKKLDCGNKPMNNDMFSTLKAEEHPYIQIELIEARPSTGKSLILEDTWIPVEATVNFTIAGVTHKETLSIQGKKLDELEYRFKSSKTLLFTDYGIKPPRALMGLVKVANEITIELDLTVTIQAQM